MVLGGANGTLGDWRLEEVLIFILLAFAILSKREPFFVSQKEALVARAVH